MCKTGGEYSADAAGKPDASDHTDNLRNQVYLWRDSYWENAELTSSSNLPCGIIPYSQCFNYFQNYPYWFDWNKP